MKTIAVSSTLLLFAGLGLAGPAHAAEDWLRRDESNGLVYYYCTSDRCGREAVVSCRVRAEKLVMTTERYEKARDTQRRAFEGNGRKIELGAPARTVRGAWVLYQHPYTVGDPGKRPKSQFRGGHLAGPSLSFTVVSSSKDAGRTKRNFDQVIAFLMRVSETEARERCTPRDVSPGPADAQGHG